jgi:hypothetical protein
MTTATPIVEIAFTTTPFVTPTWVAVTAYVVSGTVTRGRTSELDKIRAGTASIILANEDRRFDPTHATGPYYPNVLPMRRLRVRTTYNAVTYDVFNGYIDRWEQVYDHPSVAYAVVTATDAFKVLAAKDFPSSAYAVEVLADSPAYWWRLGEPADATSALDAIAGVPATIVTGGDGSAAEWAFGAAGLVTRDSDSALSKEIQVALAADHAVVAGTDPDFTVEMIVKSADPAMPVGQYLFELEPSSGPVLYLRHHDGLARLTCVIFNRDTGLTYTTSEDLPDDKEPHHVAVVVDGGVSLNLYVDGVATGVATTIPSLTWPASGQLAIGHVPGASGVIGWWGTIDEFAVYNTALSATRVAAHSVARATPWAADLSGARVGRVLDSISWPAADRNIDTGQSTLQATSLTGSVLAYLQKVEESEGGLLYVTKDGKLRFRSRHGGFNLASQGTFGDGGGAELEYVDIAFDYSETLIYNETRVSRADGTVQTAKDATSQTNYGARTYTLDGLLITSDAESLDRANFLLGKYKDPVLRTTRMVVEPSGANAVDLFPQVLGREVGEKLTVRRKPQNVGVTIDQAVIIEGMKHDFRDRFWSTEFMLSPSSASSTPGSGDADYLQLNDTDGPGLGFVRLAY